MNNVLIVFINAIIFYSLTVYGRSFIPFTYPNQKSEVESVYTRTAALVKYFKDLAKDICDNPEAHKNQAVEARLRVSRASVLNENFNMNVYKDLDVVSWYITNRQAWEKEEMAAIYGAFEEYMREHNTADPSSLTFLDIGVQIGWYSLLMSMKGFNVVGFDASSDNAYVARKNFCLVKDKLKGKVLLVEKALGDVTMNCSLYSHEDNLGNPNVMCNTTIPPKFVYQGTTELVKLDDFDSFINNVVVAKIDVEGYEHHVIKGGRNVLLNKHIPYIMCEFGTQLVTLRGSDPQALLKEFIDAGYKISLTGFNRNYVSTEKAFNDAGGANPINLYLRYDP